MGTTNIVDFARPDEMTDALTELLKTGAQQLIATAVEVELVSYLAQFTGLRTDAYPLQGFCSQKKILLNAQLFGTLNIIILTVTYTLNI